MPESNDQPHADFAGYQRATYAASVVEDVELTHVGPGTPAGEYLRRFWHPVALTSQLTDLPLRLRILGEELVIFRDLGGRIGLLHKHCSHRRTSLEYGVVAERGIRCCYHGWLYDVDGTILDTPGEPADSAIRENLRHGAYPTHEYKGLVFAYLGPPGEIPAFPIYDTMDLPGNDLIPYAIDYPCNWLQVNENPMDPIHSVFLHTRATRAHFTPAWGALPVVEWNRLPGDTGIYLTNARRWEDFVWVRTAEWLAPNFAQPPDIYQNPDREKFFVRVGITKWTVPVDDTSCRIIAWRHFNESLVNDERSDRGGIGVDKVDFLGQSGSERTYEEGQRVPGDSDTNHEAQVSQGPITIHALEQMGQTDAGVASMRQMLREGIRALANGTAPPRAAPAENGLVPTTAGDVILRVPKTNADDTELRRRLASRIGAIVVETMALSHLDRAAEIERRVRGLTD